MKVLIKKYMFLSFFYYFHISGMELTVDPAFVKAWRVKTAENICRVFMQCVRTIPYVLYSDGKQDYEITDEMIEHTNRFCVYLKNWLRGKHKNALLQGILRDDRDNEKKTRSYIACAVYIGAHPDISQFPRGAGTRALHVAYLGDYHLVKYLLQKGANPNKTCGFEQWPLFGTRDKALVELLVHHGANVHKKSYGMNLLHYCCSSIYAADLCADVVALYVNQYNLNPNEKNSFGHTPLHELALASNIQSPDFECGDKILKKYSDELIKKVKILLKAGANPDIEDNEGQKVLDYAKGGEFGCSQQLIDMVHKHQRKKSISKHRYDEYGFIIYKPNTLYGCDETLFLLDDEDEC